MKTTLPILIVALTAASQAFANLITNPGFEDPIGTEWTFTIVSGASASWSSGASTAYKHSGNNSYFFKFGPVASTGKAYAEQTLTGLTPGLTYDVSGWIDFGIGYPRTDKYWGYVEALGGGAAVQSPAKGANVNQVWQQYTLTQTADPAGTLKVRLCLDKYSTTTADKSAVVYFDDVVATPVPEPAALALLVGGGLAVLFRRRAI